MKKQGAIIEPNQQYTGCFEHELKCIIDNSQVFMRVPVIFSFQIGQHIIDNIYKLKKLNPGILEDLIEDNQIIFISAGNSNRKYVAIIERTRKGLYMHIKATITDKRKAFRYRFCPFVPGAFELRKKSKLLSKKALLESLSSSGLSSLLKSELKDASKGEVLTLIQKDKLFNIKIVKVDKHSPIRILRARIVNSNIDVSKYTSFLYMKTFKQVINDLQKITTAFR